MDYRDYEAQNSVAITDMRLRTDHCALSSARIYNNAPLFFFVRNIESTEAQNSVFSVFKNKGAGERILRLLRAQPLVRSRVSVKSILFVGFGNIVLAQKQIK
jgi:hypothetical protein